MKTKMKTKIICLCGSSRFVGVMAVCAWLLEKQEKAITTGLHLLPNWYTTITDHLAEAENCADEMDALHLKKIDIADEIFVVNYDFYIEESTAREIKYAQSKNKKIRWFTNDPIGSYFLTITDRETKVKLMERVK